MGRPHAPRVDHRPRGDERLAARQQPRQTCRILGTHDRSRSALAANGSSSPPAATRMRDGRAPRRRRGRPRRRQMQRDRPRSPRAVLHGLRRNCARFCDGYVSRRAGRRRARSRRGTTSRSTSAALPSCSRRTARVRRTVDCFERFATASVRRADAVVAFVLRADSWHAEVKLSQDKPADEARVAAIRTTPTTADPPAAPCSNAPPTERRGRCGVVNADHCSAPG
jgi:hypothetical protein